MDAAQLDLLVRSAISGEIAENWVYYALMLAVVVVGVTSVAFVAPYLQARGKAYATKADFDALLEQLQKTTETTEKIKTAVSHEDWRLRERNTLRRQKLEALLLSIYDCHDWLERRREWWYMDEDKSGFDPSHKLNVIAQLYFPELKQPKQFTIAFYNMNKVLVDQKIKIAAAKKVADEKKDAEIYGKALDGAVKAYQPMYQSLVQATTVMEQEAAALMKDLL